MTAPLSRPRRHVAQAAPAVPYQAPHAALLIDFDNVTMGIRSDLTKELKSLLNSDIIRGKVTVQRAYADWRRYPQYIMPLTERSIDMIWAAAVGSTKKNATDIRLAIDAIELVFTRPEIGTFIVLSGDSDFSSLVLKLKEYGKYVIGIGIRESASDLLVQNCDEYYSYSELAGLSREVDTPSVQRDPWELIVEAVERMVRQNDVMRSDRLKQVMQQIDPNFDERNAGFNRFSKFVSEAATKGLVQLTKLENGQFEVAAAERKGAAPAAGREAPARERERERDRDRGGRGRGRGRGRERGAEAPPERARSNGAPPAEARRQTPAPVAGPANDHLTLGGAFSLLTRALGELTNPVGHEGLRARMSAIHGREDPLLEADRFARLLRQANDAEVADVKKTGDDAYEVSLTRSGRAMLGRSPFQSATSSVAPAVSAVRPAVSDSGEQPAAEAPAAESEPAAPTAYGRFRRGSRSTSRSATVPLIGVVDIQPDLPVLTELAPAATAVEAPPVESAKAEPKSKARGGRRSPARKTAEPVAAQVEAAAEPAPKAPRARTRTPRGKKAV